MRLLVSSLALALLAGCSAPAPAPSVLQTNGMAVAEASALRMRDVFTPEFRAGLNWDPSNCLPWETPEGLQMADEVPFDPRKPTVLFVHGWAPQRHAFAFSNAKGWQKAGYNAMIFRWHRDSYEAGLIPLTPERKIWSGLGEKLVREYEAWFSRPEGYDREIRVIGHSLGCQLSFYLTYRLYRENAPMKPARLELLDPFASGLPIPSDTSPEFALPGQQRQNSKVLENGLRWLTEQPDAPAIVDCSCDVGRIFLGSLQGVVHYQAMNAAWLGGVPPLQHVRICAAYLDSIDPDKAPLHKVKNQDFYPFSAQLKTSQIRAMRRMSLSQTEGLFLATPGLQDDQFKIE